MFGHSAAGTLKQALRGRRADNPIASFGDDLSWGPINSLGERVEYFDTECPIPGGWDWLPETHDDFWKEAGQDADERLIWLSANSAHEMAGYLAYLEKFPDRPAFVVRPNEHLPAHPTYGPLLGTGTANIEQLAEVLSSAERRPMSDDAHLFDRWHQLRSENALLRIIEDGRLVSAPVDTYDRLLLDAAMDRWQKGVLVVGKALGASFDEQIRVSSDLLFTRLGALVRSGQLEAQGNVLGWDEESRRAPALVRKPV